MIGRYVIRDRDANARLDVNGDVVVEALAEADERSLALCSWDERIRYEKLARAVIETMGGERS